MSVKSLKKALGEMLILSVQAKGMARGIEKSEQAIDIKDYENIKEVSCVLAANVSTIEMVIAKYRRLSPISKKMSVKK